MQSPVVTRAGLAGDLRALGLSPGDDVLVHSSLRSLGLVVGGAPTVVRALLDAIGSGGTLVVPAFTADNRDPGRWAPERGIPERLWDEIRCSMPPFDSDTTPSSGVGLVAETVRTWPGALRSGHPQTSFAALGPAAAGLTEKHPWDCHLGPESPLGLLAGRPAAKVLLLGVGYDVCTTFHLAEYRWPGNDRRTYEFVADDGTGPPGWRSRTEIRLDQSDFADLGTAFEGRLGVRRGAVGAARGRLFGVAEAAAFAERWFAEHRTPRFAPA